MPGSGSDERGVSEKLLHELRTAMSLLSKNLPVTSVALAMDEAPNVYTASVRCDTGGVVLGGYEATVVEQESAVDDFKLRVVLGCLPRSADLKTTGVGFHWATVTHSESVFRGAVNSGRASVETQGVRFENMEVPQVTMLDVGAPTAFSQQLQVERLQVARPLQVEVPVVRGNRGDLVSKVLLLGGRASSGMAKARSRKMPKRFFSLPLTRRSVPMHRFSDPLKVLFREALAERLKTTPDRVLLRRVYDRVHMAQYRTVKHSARGVLLCYPKESLLVGGGQVFSGALKKTWSGVLEKGLLKKKAIQESLADHAFNRQTVESLLTDSSARGVQDPMVTDVHYLVFGECFDSKKKAKAIVPMPLLDVELRRLDGAASLPDLRAPELSRFETKGASEKQKQNHKTQESDHRG